MEHTSVIYEEAALLISSDIIAQGAPTCNTPEKESWSYHIISATAKQRHFHEEEKNLQSCRLSFAGSRLAW
jgi:hypothetical protein